MRKSHLHHLQILGQKYFYKILEEPKRIILHNTLVAAHKADQQKQIISQYLTRYTIDMQVEPTCAASEINSNTRSLPEIVSHISPKVPFSSVKPTARASAKEREPFLSPICST